MPIDITRISRILESLVKIPYYIVLGATQNRVVIESDRDGVSSLWSMDPSGKDLKKIVSGPVIDVATPRPNSPYIVYTKDLARGRELHGVFIAHVSSGGEKQVEGIPPMRIFSIEYSGSYIAFIGAAREGVGLYLVKSNGRGYEKLLDLETIAMVSDVSDKYIVGFGALYGNPRSLELFIYDLSSNEFKKYTPREGSSNYTPLIYGEDKLLFESNYTGELKLYIYDIENNSLDEPVFNYKDYYEYKPVQHTSYRWINDYRIWVVGVKNGRSKLFLDGKEIPLPNGTISGVAYHDKHFYISMSSLNKPPHVLKTGINGEELGVVIENDPPREIGEAIGDVEFVKYKSFDELEIPMYVVYSNKASKPGPGVIYVHGGPWSEVSDRWITSIAALATLGYHVLAPNFRGSTGYGEEFRLLDIGDPGGGDLEDIVYARRWGVDNKVLDSERVAIMGYSYGGFMTYLAMGRYPEHWRCGVAGAGITDWEEMYSLSDALFKKFVDMLFDNKRELWRERSPITYVEKVDKPLCIIHPQNDSRTPLKPVLKYMEKLLELGKTFEVHIAPDMGHVITSIDDAVKILLPALIFLEKYLKQ